MKTRTLAIFSILILFASMITPSYSSASGDLVIYLKNTKGDRISAYGTILKIYDSSNSELIVQLDPVKENKHFEVNLLHNNQYKVEAFVHDIYASTDYVTLTSDFQRMDLILPNTGGIKFQIVYNDGNTPVSDAAVVLKTFTGKQIRQDTTDLDGNTLRMWIPSTIQTGDYYEIEVKLSDNISYNEKPINLLPSAQVDYKIVTPWPPIVDSLVTFTIYKNEYQKLESSDGSFVAKLYQNGKQVAESTISPRAEAHFSKISVGDYDVEIIQIGDKEPLIKKTVSIIGDKLEFKLFGNEITTKTQKTIIPTSETHLQEAQTLNQNCKCVAFRLDDVQDYWLNDAQIQIINTFNEKQAPLTIGIIGGQIGNDAKLNSYLDETLNSNKIEIANHGWLHEDFTNYNKTQQTHFLKQTNQKIYELYGISPTVFIPPLNNFNDETIAALKDSDMTHFSSEFDYSTPPYPLSNLELYNFPEGAFTGDLNHQRSLFVGVSYTKTLNQIHESLDKYGFVVVTIHPQEFSVVRDGSYTNEVNWTQIGELENLIDKIREEKLSIVPIGKINLDSKVIFLPDWIRNNAKWWSEGKIEDNDFVSGIQFLIKEKIMQIPQTAKAPISTGSEEIPSWIKNNADWWSQGLIADDDFVNGIQYLVEQGIIKV